MPEEPQTFEHSLEADMRQLAAEIKHQRERPEMKNAAEKELLKEAIRAFPERSQGPPASAASGAPQPAASQSLLPSYAQNASPETKLEIEYLLEVALRQGFGKALAEARKSPYFVQDAFHDALVGRLYPELRKRGIAI
jgi:hypothetical protein